MTTDTRIALASFVAHRTLGSEWAVEGDTLVINWNGWTETMPVADAIALLGTREIVEAHTPEYLRHPRVDARLFPSERRAA